MRKLELVENKELGRMGHFFCEECGKELNVVLSWNEAYQNPAYTKNWDKIWHEFHAVRYLFPKLLKIFHRGEYLFKCPSCHNSAKSKLVYMTNGLFDLSLIRASLDAYGGGFDCVKCGCYYASQKCGTKIRNDYICGDCAMLA